MRSLGGDITYQTTKGNQIDLLFYPSEVKKSDTIDPFNHFDIRRVIFEQLEEDAPIPRTPFTRYLR